MAKELIMPLNGLHIHEENIDRQGTAQETLENQVKWSILSDLIRLNWTINFPQNGTDKITIEAPSYYDKSTIKQAMSYKRQEILMKNRKWIDSHIKSARENIANGYDVLQSNIDPIIHVCQKESEHRLFRIFRYYWSSPYSEYVGRRIKLLIRDYGLPSKPVIGIAALGSPIIHIPERDEWIGWDRKTRTKNLIFTMDAYVIGALPPYNLLLGGKLISYILASTEVRNIYKEKYKNSITLIEKRSAADLAGFFTTSLYGNSSQYNRIKFNDSTLYNKIGSTKGFGTLHLSEHTLNLMQQLLKSKGVVVNHKFGDGPSWVMRVVRAAGDVLGFDSDFLLRHSFKRDIYFVPFSSNSREFLCSRTSNLDFHNYSQNELVSYWKERWLTKRRQNPTIVGQIKNFRAEHFAII